MKKLSWLAFFLISISSCLDEPDCFQLHNNILGLTFRVIGTNAIDTVLLRNNSGDLVRVTELQDVLNYFDRGRGYNFAGVFKYIEDTRFLEVEYAVKNQFISEECGSSFVLSDLRVVGHDFDSVRVVNPTPTKNGGPNIDLLRCPETDSILIDFSQLMATTNGATITNQRSINISYDFSSIGNPENSVFEGRAATIKLPIDLSTNSTKYVFEFEGSKDSLTFSYNLVTEERYKACGIQTFVSNLTIGENSFDSVSYQVDDDDEPVRTILDPHEANLRIFKCPQTNLMKVDFVTEPTVLAAVTINSITANHFEGNYLTDPITTNTVELPVDPESGASTFNIEYKYNDGDVQTVELSVAYTRTALQTFIACPNPVIIGLREATDVPNVSIPTNGTILQYPTVKNVEITVD
jgi:hypothetical protein